MSRESNKSQAALGESIGKTVGSRRPASALSVDRDQRADAAAWMEAFRCPFVPRGVYRFKSHEEADEWMWMMITRPRPS
jgi:hypothetical protein